VAPLQWNNCALLTFVLLRLGRAARLERQLFASSPLELFGGRARPSGNNELNLGPKENRASTWRPDRRTDRQTGGKRKVESEKWRV